MAVIRRQKMWQTKLVHLEVAESEHTEEHQELSLPEHIAKLRGCLAGIDQADVAADARLAYLLEKHG